MIECPAEARHGQPPFAPITKGDSAMRWFILGLLGVVVFAAFAAIVTSLRALRLHRAVEAEAAAREVLLLPPPKDDPQAPGHPDAVVEEDSRS